jgi:hypothetical protein
MICYASHRFMTNRESGHQADSDETDRFVRYLSDHKQQTEKPTALTAWGHWNNYTLSHQPKGSTQGSPDVNQINYIGYTVRNVLMPTYNRQKAKDWWRIAIFEAKATNKDTQVQNTS